MKFFKAALLCFAIIMANVAIGQSNYAKVKIEVNSVDEAQKLSTLGVAVDHGVWKKNWFETDLSADEIALVRSAGFTCEVIIADVKKFYVERNNNKSAGTAPTIQGAGCNPPVEPATPSGFALGSMGGFFTYEEFLANLDTMAARYPALISTKAPISNFQTAGGRPIYFLKISDNPTQNESGVEPQVLYTAIHHAREPQGLSQLIFYMYYLLENYATNTEVKYIVDNTEMYFVPMINPDGYVYNQTTDPNGGGLWRKNRRNNGNGTFGVDPNRNYDYEWGTTGISTNGNNETYCGTAPFSEPETQAMKWLIENNNFKLALNYHTYANLLLYPWGYVENLLCDDNDLYVAITNNLVTSTELIPQLSSQLYPASGTADDWAYGDVTNKPKVFAMTPELGNDSDGFWPQQERIIPISQNQVEMNLKLAYTATNYGVVKDITPAVLSTTQGYIKYNLQRLGLQDGNFTVSISPITNIQTVGNANTHTGLLLGQTITDSIAYTLPSNIVGGTELTFALSLSNGLITFTDTITKLYGLATIVFSNSGTPLSDWVTTDGWNLTNITYFSAPNSLTDSPIGNYLNNTVASIISAQPIDLTAANFAYLRFKAKWDIEPGFDYAQVAVSTNGQNWTPLCGKYTTPGTENQDIDNPIYDGTQSNWVDEEINLTPYIGGNIFIRFILVTDQGVEADGMYIDDLTVEAVTTLPDGIAENTLGKISLYPNPANNVLYVAYAKALNYTVFDMVGRQLVSGNTTGNNSIDIAPLSKGIYFIRLAADGKQAVLKFVKE